MHFVMSGVVFARCALHVAFRPPEFTFAYPGSQEPTTETEIIVFGGPLPRAAGMTMVTDTSTNTISIVTWHKR